MQYCGPRTIAFADVWVLLVQVWVRQLACSLADADTVHKSKAHEHSHNAQPQIVQFPSSSFSSRSSGLCIVRFFASLAHIISCSLYHMISDMFRLSKIFESKKGNDYLQYIIIDNLYTNGLVRMDAFAGYFACITNRWYA